MRAVVFTGDRQLELMTFPDPTPGPDEVVIEMKASGMCGSDLHHYRRPKAGGETGGLAAPSAPTIAGHEPCGIVAAVGTAVSPSLAQVGQRVMVHHYEGCRVCGHCRSGWSQLCQEVPVKVYGNNAHGGHAAYMKVPAFTVVPLPDELSFTTGAAISCGTGTAYGALRRIRLSGNDTIAIFGQGPVGLSATQLAAAMGARVIALDVSPERLARAKEFGAAATDGAPSAALHPKVVVQPGDIILAKPHFGSFQATELETILRARGIDTVLIGGIATNFCCDTTAREAHAREFKVLFLSDGTATIDLRDTAGGTIPADQVQRLTLATLAFAFAEVLSVAEACEKLQSTRTRATA
jgi:D-arabinose 1-dehydrogenase-like Zn-dependent alcohol dehydrogenase